MKFLLNLLAKIFLGTGIGTQKFPFLFSIYKKLNKPSFKKIKYIIPLGLSLKVKDDYGPAFFLKIKGKYEPFQTKLFLQTVRKGDIVFDIGAHAGYYTLLSAKLTGPKGKVFAFEPNPENTRLLYENLKDNKLSNVTVLEKALAEKNGSLPFFIPKETSGDASLNTKEGKKIIVETVSLDNFCTKRKIFPHILKIDVEGAEDQVLAGAKKVLAQKNLRTIFIEISQKESQVPKVLKRYGFFLYLIDELKQKKLTFTQKTFEKLLKRNGYVNLLALRK